jgi:ArsR family transcriptional regulator, arsenate/arsenite/antimonite-responsive transcriptional repressor
MHLSSQCSECFLGLSCGVRLNIVNLLQKKKKLSVTEIAKHFKVTQPTISHHLIYLKEMGILRSRRVGRKIYYSIHPECGRDECSIFK